MTIQLSSGQGPAECEFAVGKLLEALLTEYQDIKIKSHIPSSKKGCYKSVLLESETDLSALEGSILWICQSPFRPGHKRKNWYVDLSVADMPRRQELDAALVRFETFRSPGRGGQHVNKVETGVRAVYTPLGLSAESTSARSQHMNKKLALDRLLALVAGINRGSEEQCAQLNWLEHMRLVRGNPVRVYEGMDFRRTK